MKRIVVALSPDPIAANIASPKELASWAKNGPFGTGGD